MRTMKKIQSVFERNWGGDRSRVTSKLTATCEWVMRGEGIPTRKWDGTACLVRSNLLFKRYDAKKGRTPPPGFEPAQDAPDEVTGHFPGWVPVGDGPDDAWHREAWMHSGYALPDRTYELIGPKVGGNPEHVECHVLIPHGRDVLTIGWFPSKSEADLFDNLYSYLMLAQIEGIVFHHPDGRMAKIKRRDLGLPWPLNEAARQ